MPDYESELFDQITTTHKATRPKQELTPLGLAEWGWYHELITFSEMLAIIDWLKESRVMA